MLGGRLMLGVVIANISIAWLLIDKIVFVGSNPGPNKNACQWLLNVFLIMLLEKPAAVDFSTQMGVGGCG